ncbi:conserved hypothetical protein [Methylobacterium sp. 4-46]|uniref:DUF447 domain-containing protein n=1 Tax=unclassified Methylobacterium TaxID=2615210 RepID=UPI000152D48C|nr:MULTISPECIES: DUF447 domain-containing protein [Methylobacterium]ACA19345.1 conserved hypothetical protein [Methylobacterium sp. 4-46]WFT78544.1 DUF447 family protein [Methylobacterium nodulans]
MPLILETIVTTQAADRLHLVPFGLIQEGDGFVLAPFRPSPTITNLEANPTFAAAAPADMRVIAGCVTGRRDWATLPCARIPGRRLAEAYGHREFEVVAVEDDPVRPRFRARIVHEEAHRPFTGYNRAQAAVLEAAILSTRLDRLPPEKVLSEMRYLFIAVSKTAGPAEREAWTWIEEKVAAALGLGAADRLLADDTDP